MAMINATPDPGFTRYGKASLYEYTNYDGTDVAHNCGQAAVATLLRAKTGQSYSVPAIEAAYPPDILWGALGTSRTRFQQALLGYGQPPLGGGGIESLKATIRAGHPAAVMLDIANMGGWGGASGGHWTVAFAYDSLYVYLSNWPTARHRTTWGEFAVAWSSWLADSIGMKNKFIRI